MEILLYGMISLFGMILGVIIILLGALATPGSDTATLSVEIIHYVLTYGGLILLLFSAYGLCMYAYTGILLL